MTTHMTATVDCKSGGKLKQPPPVPIRVKLKQPPPVHLSIPFEKLQLPRGIGQDSLCPAA